MEKLTSGYYGTSKDTHPHGGTPDHVWEELTEEFGYMFDPCPNNPMWDGLEIEWDPSNWNYCNPPYTRGEIGKWVKKAYDEYKSGKNVIMLIPSYTDTKYFHEYIYPYAELRFIKGRLKFKGYKNKASFPSMLVIFRGEKNE